MESALVVVNGATMRRRTTVVALAASSGWRWTVGELTPEPRWQDSVPWCTEDECCAYDGKRCRLIGFRPSTICEPAVQDRIRDLERRLAVYEQMEGGHA